VRLGSALSLLGVDRAAVALQSRRRVPFAWDGALRALAELGHGSRPRPRFGHGVEAVVGPFTLLGCFYPSPRNTVTGRLTEPMIDAVLRRARDLAGLMP